MLTDAQKKTQSKGERKISDILDAAGVNYDIEVTFPDLVASSGRPLRFDFIVYDDAGDIWFAIEYQGEQHYQSVGKFNEGKGLHKQRYNDRKKALYCLEKGIPLICVPYTDFHFIDYNYIMERALL